MNLSKREKEYLTLVYTGVIELLTTADEHSSTQFICNAIRKMEWNFDIHRKYPHMKGRAIRTFLSNKPTETRRFPEFYNHETFVNTYVWWLDTENCTAKSQRLLFMQALIDKINK